MGIPIIDDSIRIVIEINSMIETDQDKKKILIKVGNAIQNVRIVLELIGKNKMSVDIDIMTRVLEGLKLLRQEVERIKKIGQFIYLFQRKDCQDRLSQEVETVRFHLQSLIVSQTNSANGQINSVYGQTKEIERILAQRIYNADLEEQLENEREQAEELRRLVGANELQLQQLQSMGLGTLDELKNALKQADDDRERQFKDREEMALIIPDCPISHRPLDDPVILDCECKCTISRSSVTEWRRRQDELSTNKGSPPMCPICGQQLHSLQVTPNIALRDILEGNLFPPPTDEPMYLLDVSQSQLPHHDEVTKHDTHTVVEDFFLSQTRPLSSELPPFRYVWWGVWTMEEMNCIHVI